MISATEREAFLKRVDTLRIDPDQLEQVSVQVPGIQGFAPEGALVIPNVDKKRNSLQIYADITTNDGYIGVDQARRGLEVYGEALRTEARKNSGAHPAIDCLEWIASSGTAARSDVFRRNASQTLPAHVKQAINYLAKEQEVTPFILYDKYAILQSAQSLADTFSWSPGFRNFYAVKACPNPSILQTLRAQGMGADCSSLTELLLAEAVGFRGEEIMFTSNDTPSEEFVKARELGAIINLDDLTHIDFLEKTAGIPQTICIRYNPGSKRVGNAIIGNPVESKYGFTHEQVFEGLAKLKAKGVKTFGLQTMVASNELNAEYFVETHNMMATLACDVFERLKIKPTFLNLGGGLGTPYKPEKKDVDLKRMREGMQKSYDTLLGFRGLHPKIFMENGRFVTGPYGYLVSRVRHVTHKYKDFVGLDACMAHLPRPAIYGAYHHITILGKEFAPHDYIFDVTGSLCENNDKFAINRPLPVVNVGDIVVIYNSGAHSHAMGAQYNGKLRCPEYLVDESRAVKIIRRGETPKDYFTTFDYPGSEFAHLARK